MSPDNRRALTASAFFGALFLGVLWLALASRGEAGSEAEERQRADAATPLPVAAVEIRLADRFEIHERLAGRVVARRRSELGFERSGRLVRIEVEEGDRVEEGALLARLDTRELEARRRELRALVESTRSRLELARITAGRQRELRRADYLSPQALDEALANESTLQAQLAADRAALEHVEVGLELSSLRAPYPAVIVRRLADEGSIASPGQSVLAVLEDGVQELQLGVPPELAGGLEPGRAYEIESGSLTLEARLRSIVPELDPATRTQTAILEIPREADPAGRLADGSLAWVRLGREIETRGAWVPLGALAEGRRGTWTAFAIVPDIDTGGDQGDARGDRDGNGDGDAGRIERRQVEIIQAEAERAFVRGTLRDGDRIVRDGLHRLVPGMRVEVVDVIEMIEVPTATAGSVAAPEPAPLPRRS
jgi:RND family efflux transporter MFP subunit